MRKRIVKQRQNVRKRVVDALGDVMSEVTREAKVDPTVVDEAKVAAAAAKLSAGREILVHFPGLPAELYELRPWLGPLRELNKRHGVLLATQNARTRTELVQHSGLPVAHAPTAGELEVLVEGSDLKLCFYLSNHRLNFVPIRHPDLLHVHIGHGDSDKPSAWSNQAKAFDHLLVGGDAAVERYENLLEFDTGRLIRIGRPQLDFAEPSLPASDHPTVLYAPTWEGDRPSLRYSSIPTYGTAILRALLSHAGSFRIVLSIHPLAGTQDALVAAQAAEMREMLGEAQRSHPSSGHIDASGDDFGSVALGADVLIADNSALLTDFLAFDKPFFVTEPEAPEAGLSAGGICDVGYRVSRSTLSELGDQIGHVLTEDTLRQRRRSLVGHYFGDIADGRSTQRFLEAATDLIASRDAMVEQKYRDLKAQ